MAIRYEVKVKKRGTKKYSHLAGKPTFGTKQNAEKSASVFKKARRNYDGVWSSKIVKKNIKV